MYKFGDSYSCNPLYGRQMEKTIKGTERMENTEMMSVCNGTGESSLPFALIEALNITDFKTVSEINAISALSPWLRAASCLVHQSKKQY